LHRELKLSENGVVIAKHHSDHNDHNADTLEQDLKEFLTIIKEKQKGNHHWNWKEELQKAYRESFPYLHGGN